MSKFNSFQFFSFPPNFPAVVKEILKSINSVKICFRKKLVSLTPSLLLLLPPDFRMSVEEYDEAAWWAQSFSWIQYHLKQMLAQINFGFVHEYELLRTCFVQ